MCEKQLDGSWLCSECGYVSKWKTNMKMHIESRHLITAGVTCKVCLQFCSNRKALREGFNLNKTKQLSSCTKPSRQVRDGREGEMEG